MAMGSCRVFLFLVSILFFSRKIARRRVSVDYLGGALSSLAAFNLKFLAKGTLSKIP